MKSKNEILLVHGLNNRLGHQIGVGSLKCHYVLFHRNLRSKSQKHNVPAVQVDLQVFQQTYQ